MSKEGKKILLISLDNLYVTPYYKFYFETFSVAVENEIDIIYFDKRKNEEINGGKICGIKPICRNRILNLLNFFVEVLKKISSKEYDLIIPLHAQLLLFIFPLLMKKPGHFILDFRDYSLEKYALFRKIEKELIKKSAINFISSPGYKSFLPEGNYVELPNFPNTIFFSNVYDSSKIKHDGMPKKLGFIGAVRFLEKNIEIINFFKNDPRFTIYFIGAGSEKLTPFLEGCQNIKLVGKFNPDETLKYYEEMDVILNLYGNGTPLLDYALSNKLYLSALMRKPILVCEGTYMEKVACNKGLGMVLMMKNDAEKEKLLEFIASSKSKDFDEKCKIFLDEEKNKVKNAKRMLLSL